MVNENDPPENDSPQQDEPAKTEVVESNPALTPEVEALSTFTEREGPFRFLVLPVMEGGQTDWRIKVYMRGVQGPVYQSRESLTDEATQRFGVSSAFQDRINEALAYAKSELELPEELGDQKRAKRTLRELEQMMEDE